MSTKTLLKTLDDMDGALFAIIDNMTAVINSVGDTISITDGHTILESHSETMSGLIEDMRTDITDMQHLPKTAKVIPTIPQINHVTKPLSVVGNRLYVNYGTPPGPLETVSYPIMKGFEGSLYVVFPCHADAYDFIADIMQDENIELHCFGSWETVAIMLTDLFEVETVTVQSVSTDKGVSND